MLQHTSQDIVSKNENWTSPFARQQTVWLNQLWNSGALANEVPLQKYEKRMARWKMASCHHHEFATSPYLENVLGTKIKDLIATYKHLSENIRSWAYMVICRGHEWMCLYVNWCGRGYLHLFDNLAHVRVQEKQVLFRDWTLYYCINVEWRLHVVNEVLNVNTVSNKCRSTSHSQRIQIGVRWVASSIN